jgi:hypothetical protein
LPSDGSTDTENSGEEGEVTKILDNEMIDQPVFGKNTKKYLNKTQPLKDIIAPLAKKITADQVGEIQTNDMERQEPSAEAEKTNDEDDGQYKVKANQVDPNQSNNITADQVGDVNPSGKTGTQIPQLPLGDNSPPWGDNAVCT